MPEKNMIDMELYATIGKQIKNARNLKGISLDTLSKTYKWRKNKIYTQKIRRWHFSN